MEKIEWKDAYSVNNKEIDAQHKKWVAIYNDLFDQFGSQSRGKKDLDLSDTFKKILDYTRYHFDAEKEYMKSIDYPNIVEHIRKHKDFDDLVYKLSREIADGEIVLYSEVLSLIKDWFLGHVIGEDKKYARFAKGKDS